MEQEKILLQIETELVAMRTFIRKLKPEAKLHQLDIDLIKQKARSLYDSILMLEPVKKAVPKATVFDIKKPEPAEVPEEELDNSMELEKKRLEENKPVVKAEIIMTTEEEINHEVPEPVVNKMPEPELKNEVIDKPEKPENESRQEFIPEEKTETVDFEIEEEPALDKKEDQVIEKEDPVIPASQQQADLFSSTSETVADKFTSSGKKTLADKLTQNSRKSLRQFIGINEKFLFINELFNGDMSRYNHAIDELDSLPTLKGAKTYLFELKVQNMWSDDLDAYIKLAELLELKFS